MKVKKETIARALTFEDFLQKQLLDPDFQKEYLKFNIEDYAQNGDYSSFFRALERVVKARCSISKFAKSINVNRSNLTNIFKGRVQPGFDTTMKILKGLGAEVEIKFA